MAENDSSDDDSLSLPSINSDDNDNDIQATKKKVMKRPDKSDPTAINASPKVKEVMECDGNVLSSNSIPGPSCSKAGATAGASSSRNANGSGTSTGGGLGGKKSDANEDDAIVLSDSDSEEAAPNPVNADTEDSGNPDSLPESPIDPEPGRYRLRRKRKINYAEVENPEEGKEEAKVDELKGKKKDIFCVFSLPLPKLEKLTRDPSSIDLYTKLRISFGDGADPAKFNQVIKFLFKCGSQFDTIFIQTSKNSLEKLYPFLRQIFSKMTLLSRIIYRYHDSEDAYQFLKVIDSSLRDKYLPALNSLKLCSIPGSVSLREQHLDLLANFPDSCHWTSLELGDSLWEDVKASTLEKLLTSNSPHLETLIIHGGFMGTSSKESICINIPKMDRLKTLCICPTYGFISEIKDPYSKKQRIVTLGGESEEPYKISIKFTVDPPNLQKLILGNLIEIQDLHFSTLRKLLEFKCGSHWNLSITLPSSSSRRSLLESSITDLQFPDMLKDPFFPAQMAKYFPNLKKVWISLPSVPVLRSFFKAFAKSELEDLYLKTQFDFENTMESCLLPRMEDVLRRSAATSSILNTLKEYKHFQEYVKYYNIELPVEQDDLMEGHSEGIGALKSLKVLHLEHIPRRLLIPNPEDERKWYDHNCKFMSTTFGYTTYPLNEKVHREILKLNLDEYYWKNIAINVEFTEDFHEAGFVDISSETVEMMEYQQLSYHAFDNNEEEFEDIFSPVQMKARRSGANVKIMPSMLAPVFKAKEEGA